MPDGTRAFAGIGEKLVCFAYTQRARAVLEATASMLGQAPRLLQEISLIQIRSTDTQVRVLRETSNVITYGENT